MGGAEKVLEALLELYDAPIYTLIKGDLSKTPFANRTIHTSFLQSLPFGTRYFRSLLPLFPRAIEGLDLSSYDLIFSSSYCMAKSVIKKPHQKHICYCHTPMRFAWDRELYPMHPLKKALAAPFLNHLREYDKNTQSGVDHFIANSTHVAKRIKNYYGRDATVIYPPVDTHLFQIAKEREEYFITCGRLVSYKRFDLLVDAFRRCPTKTLIIVGDGPERKRLEKKAPSNVKFMGFLPQNNYCELLSKAKGFVYAAEEDFGIVLAEGQAAGIPVIAYGKGGSEDIVLPGITGIYFSEQTADAIAEALFRFEKLEKDFNPESIQEHALRFSKERFHREIQTLIAAT